MNHSKLTFHNVFFIFYNYSLKTGFRVINNTIFACCFDTVWYDLYSEDLMLSQSSQNRLNKLKEQFDQNTGVGWSSSKGVDL